MSPNKNKTHNHTQRNKHYSINEDVKALSNLGPSHQTLSSLRMLRLSPTCQLTSEAQSRADPEAKPARKKNRCRCSTSPPGGNSVAAAPIASNRSIPEMGLVVAVQDGGFL